MIRSKPVLFGAVGFALLVLWTAAPTHAQVIDTCPVCPQGCNVIWGTAGRDVLIGTNGCDCIYGLGGNDFICGRGGDDIICGGDGSDLLNGEGGTDYLYGQTGNDQLCGEMQYGGSGIADDCQSGFWSIDCETFGAGSGCPHCNFEPGSDP